MAGGLQAGTGKQIGCLGGAGTDTIYGGAGTREPMCGDGDDYTQAGEDNQTLLGAGRDAFAVSNGVLGPNISGELTPA